MKNIPPNVMGLLAVSRGCSPHPTAVAFAHSGRALFDAMNLIGVRDVPFNHPKTVPFPEEYIL